MSKTISVELNDEQYKRYETMLENGMDVGEVIDLIFDIREQFKLQSNEYLEERVAELNNKKEELSEEMSTINQELGVLDKLADSTLNFNQKKDIIEKEYATINETYEMRVQKAKHDMSWMKDFFKFNLFFLTFFIINFYFFYFFKF